ncbi:MAG: helix-turn-helix transcriptional regulator [Coriobacteriia bacterium]|nr:helix-turn-helix transcriptional regulator [Coriobacteriia bacterium]
MAMNAPFGKVLRDAREAQGIELNEAARRLRIRPDILRAIEANDFAHMPPRGYARNMVNAYARFLELNPTEITRAYVTEMNAYSAGADADYDESPRRSRSGADAHGDRSYRSENGRQVYSDRMDSRSSVGYADLRSGSQVGRGARPSSGGQPYTNFYSGGNQGAGGILDFIKEKWFLFAGAIVVILLIVLVFNVISCATKAPEEETPTVPITGVADTTGGSESGEGSGTGTTTEPAPAPVETAPTAANFTYKVSSGATAYVQVNVDGKNVLDDDVSDSQSYEVKGKLTFMTDSPDNVTCTVDNEKVKLKENSIGLYECTVDFAKILSDWQKDHPTAGTTVTGTTTGTTGTTGTDTATSGNTASSAGTAGANSASSASSTNTASSAGATGTTGGDTSTTETTGEGEGSSTESN